MGGFFGAVCNREAISDVFFGTDYHSHLGTKRAGMAAYDNEIGLQREIHNISNSPFRTRFEHIFDEMKGTAAIGCISDSDPQPLLICSNLVKYMLESRTERRIRDVVNLSLQSDFCIVCRHTGAFGS